MSLSSLNTSLVSNDSVFSRAGGVNGGGGGQVLGRSPNFTLAALRQLGIHLEEGEDIDSFIANLTIPPPPEGSVVRCPVQWLRASASYCLVLRIRGIRQAVVLCARLILFLSRRTSRRTPKAAR